MPVTRAHRSRCNGCNKLFAVYDMTRVDVAERFLRRQQVCTRCLAGLQFTLEQWNVRYGRTWMWIKGLDPLPPWATDEDTPPWERLIRS